MDTDTLSKYFYIDEGMIIINSYFFKKYPEQWDRIKSLLKEYSIQEKENDFRFLYLAHRPIINSIDSGLSFHKQKKRFQNQFKDFSKLFTKSKGDYIGGIENQIHSITINTDENQTFRFDDERLLNFMNFALYKEYLKIQENNEWNKPEYKDSSYLRRAIEKFYGLFLYLKNETKIKSFTKIYQFLVELIGILGLDLSDMTDSILPENYIKDTFKELKKRG